MSIMEHPQRIISSDDHTSEDAGAKARKRRSTDRKRKDPSIPWTDEDMEKLIALVRERLDPETGDALVAWGDVAAAMGNRNAKQCREKYRNDLRPDISKAPWSHKEDYVLALAHSQLGNKWSDISKYLPRRAENTIKNHWYATNRAKGDAKPKTFLWLYSSLWEEDPRQDCLAIARNNWAYLAATSDGQLPPLEEFEVDLNYFTTGPGAIQNAVLQQAELEASATMGNNSAPVRSATARAAAISGGGVTHCGTAPSKRSRTTADSVTTAATTPALVSHLPSRMTMPGALPSAQLHSMMPAYTNDRVDAPWMPHGGMPAEAWQPGTMSSIADSIPAYYPGGRGMSEAGDASCHVAYNLPGAATDLADSNSMPGKTPTTHRMPHSAGAMPTSRHTCPQLPSYMMSQMQPLPSSLQYASAHQPRYPDPKWMMPHQHMDTGSSMMSQQQLSAGNNMMAHQQLHTGNSMMPTIGMGSSHGQDHLSMGGSSRPEHFGMSSSRVNDMSLVSSRMHEMGMSSSRGHEMAAGSSRAPEHMSISSSMMPEHSQLGHTMAYETGVPQQHSAIPVSAYGSLSLDELFGLAPAASVEPPSPHDHEDMDLIILNELACEEGISVAAPTITTQAPHQPLHASAPNMLSHASAALQPQHPLSPLHMTRPGVEADAWDNTPKSTARTGVRPPSTAAHFAAAAACPVPLSGLVDGGLMGGAAQAPWGMSYTYPVSHM